MSCIEYGVTIIGDENDRLLRSVNHVAGFDSAKRNIVAGYLSDNDFLSYMQKETGIEKPLEVNANTLRRLLNSYYMQKHIDVENSINKKNANAINGFSSAKAKSIAKDHTANLVLDKYYYEVTKPKDQRLTRPQILKSIMKDIEDNFNKLYAVPLIKRLQEQNLAKDYIEKARNVNNDIKRANTEYNKLSNTLKETNDITEQNNIKSKLRELKEELNTLNGDKYVMYSIIVNEFGNTREKNYGNLVSQIKGNPNEWFNDVFTISKLVNIVNQFNVILQSDILNEPIYEDDLDVSNSDSESIDEMSKSWEDKLYKSFDQNVAADVKLYLSRLYNLDSPVKAGDTQYNYDTNNELGVPMTMGSNYIIAQISNYASFYSVNDFIQSIERASQNIRSLYGLGKLVNDMKANSLFANRIFTELNNPKINKSIITVTDTFNIDQSNKSIDTTGAMLYSLINQAKSTFKNAFNVNDSDSAKTLATQISREKSNYLFMSSPIKYKADEFIKNIFSKYFPKLDINAVTEYLNNDIENIIKTYSDFLQDINNLINNVEKIIDDEAKVYNEYSNAYRDWVKSRDIANQAGFEFNQPMPIYDSSSINYSVINAALINISKKITNFTAVKNELNSTNAEGNLASDLIKNSFITNTIKQIQYGTPEEQNAGLNALKDFIIKSPQYQYSPIFFGIKDNKGNTLIPGLFERDSYGKVNVNPAAKDVINISLFDGIRDSNNSKSALYNNMSKGDYFVSQMIAFEQPITNIPKTDIKFERAGYFMRTPSDAPKNFIIEAPKAKIEGLWQNVVSSENVYVDKVINDIQKSHTITSGDEFDNRLQDITLSVNTKNNYYSAEEIYNLLTNPIENKNYNRLYTKYDSKTNKVIIPIVYKNQMIIELEGDKAVDTIQNIAENIVIKNIYTDNNKKLPYDFIIDIRNSIIEEGVNNGSIERITNKNHAIFRGFYSHLLGELNNFVLNLNNVFEKNNKGEWVTKDNTENLIDRAHYNGEIVKDGKLTGNFFKFIRLFEVNGFNTNNRLNNSLLLYREGNRNSSDNLFSVTRNGKLKLNIKRNDLIKINNGQIELNISEDNVINLENIVTKWINNFTREIYNRSRQYETIIEDRFDINQINEAILNGSIMEMNFDDLFEGDTKFYKNAQDFLKRAKEVQAGGKSYAGFNFSDALGSDLYNVKDINGQEQTILINGREYLTPRRDNGSLIDTPMKARNGFKAVTIYNTIHSVDNAESIREELRRINEPKLGKEIANRIADQITEGYVAQTIANDAQSYITFEEWIARRYADGTLDQYYDIIEPLINGTPIQDINLKEINARIQVDKNFYFDKQFDPITKTFYPRQIKNAEFVLIPQLLPEGSSLRQLYDIMKSNDIGQVNTAETSKAAKKNILTFWDNNGVANPEAFEQAVKQDNYKNVETYYYRYLYKQQEVPEHMKDEHNKAGIQIMKKIIDNASTASENVKEHINNLFETYSANIKEDFNLLLDRMGWKTNKDGKLVNKDGSDFLDFTDFYRRARVEAQRLGMDSNFIEYLTPDEFGSPSMPNYMNNVSSKLESIAQSIFNAAITRQTLPGWHAAQITNVGFSKKLNYHPEIKDENGNIIQEAYAEVLLPRWSNLIPKDYDIYKLEQEGLDIHIGYRIPTEGKQSVSILKVVGFLDDIYGSTIVVPDAWVTQTGSDFDVDSVYGIAYELIYNRRKDLVTKVKYDSDNSIEATKNRYIKYVNNNLKERVDRTEIIDEFKQNKINDLYNSIINADKIADESKAFTELMAQENALYQQLPQDAKNIIINSNNTNKNDDFVTKTEKSAAAIELYGAETSDETLKQLCYEIADYQDAIADLVRNSKDDYENRLEDFRTAKKDAIISLYTEAEEEYFNTVQKTAKEAGIESFEEFFSKPIVEQNTRRARNNRILDSMIEIMKDESSREENYSRSNFEDISNSMKKYNAMRGATALARSTYNPFDQIDFMENAMSGAQLKAFSVTRDTFNSVNNYIHTELDENNAVIVEYSVSEYNPDIIKTAYGENAYSTGDKFIKVKHNRLAWSDTNRNVVGKLITPYSSQTTAHILDAIKEGAIFNENQYTFGSFKTLIDLGVDYDTAIAFLMQPGITRIVEAYNETKSIYINQGSNPIQTAIKNIAKDLGITIGGKEINLYTPIAQVYTVLSENNKLQNAIFDLFGAKIDRNTPINEQVFALNKERLETRLNEFRINNNSFSSNENAKYKEAAFDLAMIVAFDRLHNTTKMIEEVARCSNPDRFGAKQTIRATRNTYNKMLKYSTDLNNPVTKALKVNGKPMLSVLYPGIENGDINVNNSVYPYLAAFLKYATIPSISANSRLFPTEGELFNKIIDTVETQLKHNFTDEQYKEFKQYMISNIYSGVQFLTTPLTINDFGYIMPDEEMAMQQESDNTFYWNAEKARIFGYDVTESSNLKVSDINNPTKEDISKFNKLTPAQKVMWIQQNFVDGKGVFDFLNVNMFNQYEVKQKGFSSQSIRYSDQIDNIEEIYIAFRDSFFNKNPFVRLASIDLIKYAFVVEGFKFKKGAISKIITNDSMLANIEDKGLNLINAIEQQFTVYSNPMESATQSFIQKFIRSHSEMVTEYNLPKAKRDKQGNRNIGYIFNTYMQSENLVYIPYEESSREIRDFLNISEDSPKDYIRITKTVNNNQKRTTLYNIINTNKGIYLIPLNLLERNETSDYSINPKNNIYKAYNYYRAIVDAAIDNQTSINELKKDNTIWAELTKDADANTIKPHKSKKIVESVENENEINRVLQYGTNYQKAELTRFVNDITDYFKLPVEEQGNYVLIKNDNNFISSLIPRGAVSVQNIPMDDSTIKVKIQQVKPSNNFRKILKGDKKGDLTKVLPEEKTALKRAIDTKSVNPILYKVERITEEQEKEDYERLKNEIENDFSNFSSAVTNIIEDIDVNVTFNYSESDKVAKDIFNELNKRARAEQDEGADKFISKMDIHGVDRFSANSIHNNRKSIYTAAASYYADKARKLLTNINSFITEDGQKFAIDDSALYKHITENPNDYPILLKLILDAKTFGEQFYDIFNLNITGEDSETSAAIEKIRKAINEVRTNSKLKKAVELLFNDYIANNYSTNPLIRQGLIELRTTFGDTDWFDLNFSDVGELNHKQVQTVAKYVYSIINESVKITAPKAVAKFTEEYDAIMKREGSFDFNKIVTKEGKFITPYTDKFLEDRQKVIDNLKTAEQLHGINSIEYIKAKIARDKWRAKNTYQQVIPDYYNRDVALRERVVKDAPEEYRKYMELIHELYGNEATSTLLTSEERSRRKQLNRQIRNLTSEFNEDKSPKTDEQIYRAKALEHYIAAKKELNKEFFLTEETEEFRAALNYYTKIIKNYETKHPNENLDQRLTDENYRNAYEWLNTNSIYTLTGDAQKKVYDAFNILKSKDNNDSKDVKNILEEADAYDAYGNIDPRKLSNEQLNKIKELTQHKYSWTYENNSGEAILIKDVPAGLPVISDKFYRSLRDSSENAPHINPLRLKLIGKINQLLGKALDANTNTINTKDLFEKLTETELSELASYYRQLHNIKGNRDNVAAAKKFKKNVEFKVNQEGFNREWAYAQLNLKGTKQFDTWLSIFVQTNKNGEYVTDENGAFVPNGDIYGYIEPKDKTYIDEAKTEARNLIENDLQFVPTEYYYMAMNEATANGTFNEWFNQNHVYNPYTHKMEPLKVWTTMEVNPNGNLKGSFDYIPTYENLERQVKDEYRNTNYKEFNTNYNLESGEYNNTVNLSEKEKDMLNYLQSIVNMYSTNHSMKAFAQRGFLPRRPKYEPDAKWFLGQVIGSFGLEFRNTKEAKWSDIIDYTHDHDADFDMMTLLKRKGYQEPIKITPKGTYETEEDYLKRVEQTKARNKEIEAENLKLDNQILDRDWKSVFQDFIAKATEYNAKERAKNTIYLLLEDLKENPAYKVSRWSGGLKKDTAKSTLEHIAYQTIKQDNTYSIVENWAKRVIFREFKKDSKFSKWADLAQNITSAKYMIFNVTGGIANITTGLTNIYGEIFARDYFDQNNFRRAQAQYFNNSLSMLADMYSPTTNNLTVGLTKLFDVVDFDAFTERRPNETATERVRRVRDLLYGMQSGGEHYMQNTVLFAMLKSHRLFKDNDGTVRVGSFGNYTWKTEVDTMFGLLNGNEDLLTKYKYFLKSIKDDLNEIRKYDTFTRDFNEDFLREIGDKNLINKYIKNRKEAIKKAKEEFNQLPIAEDQFELTNGIVTIKKDSQMTSQMFGELRQKVISVNKKIHGVYDKIGAARIEREWWGGLVMQYHKHLYPGIMKRFRTKGYYNEIRSSVERGSYISLANLLSVEFKNIKNRETNDSENKALASIQSVIKASIDTIINLKMNYQLMPEWERNNVKRILGDLLGITSAFLMAIGIHMMTDDDEIKESDFLSTLIYLADRLNSESQLYTPWGLYTEGSTLFSSPVAAANGPIDLLKCLDIGVNMLFNEDYDATYTTGLYRGENRLWVHLRRNIPIYRVYERLSNMTKNNQYYRINETALNIRAAKNIADYINPD